MKLFNRAAIAFSLGLILLAGVSRAGGLFDDNPPSSDDPVAAPAPNPPPSTDHSPRFVSPPPSDPSTPPAPTPPAAPRQGSVPDQATMKATEEQVNQSFKLPNATPSPAEQEALAQKMLAEALRSTDPSAQEYVLLRDASDHAAAAGNLELALKAIARIGERFDGPVEPLQIKALDAVAEASPATPEVARRTVSSALALARRALAQRDYSLASKAAAAANQSARRAHDPALTEQVAALGPVVETIGETYRSLEPALARLAAEPTDPTANLAVGRFYCFTLEDWDQGLPLLAQGADPVLQGLAARDRSHTDSADEQLALGDAWAANARGSDARDAMERRANYWYGIAAGNVSGPRRLALLRRMTAARTAHLQHGLTAEFFNDPDFRQRLLTRVDRNVDFNWQNSPPDSGLPAQNFSARWTGWLKPATAGNYRFILAHHDGARLWIDQKLVIDHMSGGASRDQATLDLSAEFHELKIEYRQDSGGGAHIGLAWLTPGAKRISAIPPAALFHEPLTLAMQLPSPIASNSEH